MSLQSKKRLILLSLIIKGVMLYASIMFGIYLIAIADSVSANYTIVCSSFLAIVVFYLSRIISRNDFKRLFFLSREERKELDKETV